MKNTSGNPPNHERGGLGPGREDIEQEVDNIFLTHQDGDEDVGDDTISNLSCVRLVGRCETNKYGHVGREGDGEKPSVNGEEHVAEVPDGLGVLLLDVLLILVTLPPEGLLFVGDIDILNRVGRRTRPRDAFIGSRSDREIDDRRFLKCWLWDGKSFTARGRREVSISVEKPKGNRRNSTHPGYDLFSLDMLET